MTAAADQNRLTIDHEQAMNAERLRFLGALKGLDIDLTRTEDGKDYPIHSRRRTFDGEDEVVLDENQIAAGQRGGRDYLRSFWAAASWSGPCCCCSGPASRR